MASIGHLASKNKPIYPVKKTNRSTEFQFFWYYDSTHRLLPGAGWNILLLVANGHQICIKSTNADVRQRTPDDGQKDCPKRVES